MNRRYFLTVFALGAVVSTSVAAASFEDQVVAQLTSQGYKSITMERTLLGRVRIIGQNASGRREIILNPRTGEILRDLWLANAGGADGPRIRDNRDNGDDDDDYGNDDGDDDGDDDDDHSDEDDSDEDNSDENDGDDSGGEGEGGGYSGGGDEG